uniref:transposase n=1 Tax=Prevotella intermedia TaxID=28131 RepID=UPI0037437580
MPDCFGLLYTKGLTTEQIGEISDCVYGRAYSKQQVSHLASSCRDDVERWLGRSLSSHYLAVYIDAPLSPPAGTGRYPRKPTTPFWEYWRTAAGRCSPLSITPPRVPCAGKTSLRH